MSEPDPAAALRLEVGERVLWRGRARIGATWAPLRQNVKDLAFVVAFGAALSAPVVLCALIERANGRGGALTSLALIAAFVLAVAAGLLLLVEVSRRVGPYHASIVLLALTAPPASFAWARRVRGSGWPGAIASIGDAEVALWCVAALALLRIAAGIADRAGTVYVITDRRVAALRALAGAPRVVWQEPALDLRLEPSWAAPAGQLVVGVNVRRRELHVRDDPRRVLDDVVAAREGRA